MLDISNFPSPVFLLGTGYTQFLVARELAKNNVASVVMASKEKRQGIVDNWLSRSSLIKVVTNGEGEYEQESKGCRSIVVCPETSDIPGSTLKAIHSKMDDVRKIVVISPQGTQTSENRVVAEDFGLLNGIMTLGGRRVGRNGENFDFAISMEEMAQELGDTVILHRGRLVGGGNVPDDMGFGDLFYKTAGSEPDVIVEKVYDSSRLGINLTPGDSILSYPKGKRSTATEEMADKTHRVCLVQCILGALNSATTTPRCSVTAALGEVPLTFSKVDSLLQKNVL